MAIASGWAVFAVLVQIQGRPEHLIPSVLIASEFCVLLAGSSETNRAVIRGMGLGLVGALSPAPAVLYCSGLLLYNFGTLGFRQFCRFALALLLSSGIVWMAIAAIIYDGPILGLITNSARDIDRVARSEIVRVWFLSPSVPLIGVLYAQCLIMLAWSVVSSARERGALVRLGTVLLGANFAYWLYMSGVKNPPVFYRGLSLLPAVILFGVSTATANRPGEALDSSQRRGRGMLLLASLVIVAGGGSVFLAKSVIDFGRHGIRLDDARSTLDSAAVRLKPNERIGIDPWGMYSDIVLDAPPWRTLSVPYPVEERTLRVIENSLHLRYRFYLKACRNVGRIEERIGPFSLIRDPQTGTCKSRIGYGFLLYERDPSADTRGL